MIPPPQPTQEATDIFSISDQVLANRLHFIQEIGFGNWGSVWLCRPKPDPSSPSPSSPETMRDTKIAVKLVHRSKTSTTAARVRSLWNEMKVVRTFRHEPHPSIIPFYSFIITPSYALITMAYHPRLIPVEVPEAHAKGWFRSLLSGVHFIHKRGVVHNDIKPANILLSRDNVPVLVDFGFAERYDPKEPTAFHSNLSYGTPEYLSPERARGVPHDTRKSDVWSLGVTFFEVLIGRTPFEYSEGEQFSTKEDLEKYWNRTLSGKWVGNWKMSKGMENLLQRMILPNADMRCTASEATADSYWSQSEIPVARHRRAASNSHAPTLSLGLEKDVHKFFDIPPWSPRAQKEKPKAEKEKEKTKKTADKENASRPLGLTETNAAHEKAVHPPSVLQALHARSQPKLRAFEARGVSQARRNAATPSLLSALSPVRHSPPAASAVVSSSEAAKENGRQTSQTKAPRMTRKPLGPRSPTPPGSPVLRQTPSVDKENLAVSTLVKENGSRRSRLFKDLTGSASRTMNSCSAEKWKNKSSVRDRMRDWERERERLREMEALEERMREAEEQRESERERARERELEEEKKRGREREDHRVHELERQRELEEVRKCELSPERDGAESARVLQVKKEVDAPKVRLGKSASSSPRHSSLGSPPLSPVVEDPSDCSWLPNDAYSRSGKESGLSLLKQSLKLSLGMFDKTVKLYKSSTQALGRATPALSLDGVGDGEPSSILSRRVSAERDALPEAAEASRSTQEAETSDGVDRMTLWMRSVEQVVEDARQTFAASTSNDVPPPALPLSPVSRRASLTRTNRSSRIPRKILAASQIFVNECDSSQLDQSMLSAGGTTDYFSANTSGINASSIIDPTLPTVPSECHVIAVPVVPETPSRKRRATIATISPEPASKKKISLEINVTSSPSQLKEKSRSQNNLAGPITPVAKLEFELSQEKLALPPPRPQRLSEVVDKNIFIASSPASSVPIDTSSSPRGKSLDELTASPLHVDPYPPRPQTLIIDPLDTPARKHLEGVYDRFLMSTAGVKRMGRGYQSDNAGPVLKVPQQNASAHKRSQKFFLSSRRPMPPPVSSEDFQSCSLDEFGVVMPSLGKRAAPHDTSKTTVTIVRKAFKAIVSGKTVSTRFSKAL